MSRTKKELKGVTLLGAKKTTYSDRYDPSVLETFSNKHRDTDYWVTFNCPEFTSLCPITGQPDFATIVVTYVPDAHCVELKSFKEYLLAYRSLGIFNENVVNRVLADLVAATRPRRSVRTA